VKSRQGFERLEREIVREKAATLGRAGERLRAALALVDELARALEAEADPARRATRRAEYEAARRQAATARQVLIIQREAIGLRHHRDVDRQFPEPPRPA
jgi:hypothetical protein